MQRTAADVPKLSNGRTAIAASSWRVHAALGAILILGATLRTAGLSYGLPAVYNPDEVAIMTRALSFAKGDLNPHNFLYPTAYFYALFGWTGAYFAASWITGSVESLSAFQAAFFTDPSSVYLAGRLMGVVAGTATVVLIFAVANRLFGAAAGLAAAFFLAASPIHVVDSHYVKHDVATTLAIAAAFILTLRVWPFGRGREGRLRRAAVAGLACGLALSTHYYAVFATVPLAIAIWLANWPENWRGAAGALALAAVAAAAGFFALSPFILVEPATAWRDIVANRQIVVDRALIAAGPFANARRYAELLWLDTLGWPAMILALAGSARLSLVAPRRALLLSAFPIAFLLFIVNTVAASRYLNPVVPFAALFAGYAVSWLSALSPARAPVAIGLSLVAATPAVVQCVRADALFRQDDTRTLAKRFIEERVPEGAGIALQPYSVPLAPTRESLAETLAAKLGSLEALPAKFEMQLAAEPWPSPSYRLTYIGDGGLDADKYYVSYSELGGSSGLEALRRRGVEYVVLKRLKAHPPATQPFIEALEREGALLATFSPYGPAAEHVEPFLHNTDARISRNLERPGPVVEVWQLRR
ncbi:MAG: glycosyltransferase family 39 protein [Vicinamibacterales bacterium]